MAEVRSIEEYVRGPQGRADRGLKPTIEAVLADDRLADVEKVQVKCTAVPMGTNSDRDEWTNYFSVKASADQVVEGLRKQLQRSPGDMFCGQIRLNFYPMGKSSEYLTSFTRTMRPAISPDIGSQTGGLPGDLSVVAAHYDALVKPVIDQQIRLIHATTGLVEASGRLVEAKQPKAQQPSGDGMLADLLRGAVGVATNADPGPPGGPGGPIPIGPMPVDASKPPPASSPPPSAAPPPSTPPPASSPATHSNGGGQMDEASVRTWLEANPMRAKALGEDMLGRFGYKVVPS